MLSLTHTGQLLVNVPRTAGTSNLSSALLDPKEMGLDQDWLLKDEDVVLERDEHGELVELGKGQFGRVVKARKNGVQVRWVGMNYWGCCVFSLYVCLSMRVEME